MEKSTSQPPVFSRDNNSSFPSAQMEPSAQIQSTTWSEAPGDELDLGKIFALVRRRLLIIAGVAIAIMAFTIGYTLTQKPIYGGRFRMLVEPIDNGSNTLSGLTSSNNSNNPNSSTLDYPTQIQVLLDPKLILATIKKLKAAYPNLDYLSLVQNLKIERLKETKILEVGYESGDPKEVEDVLTQLSKDYLVYSLNERQANLRQGIEFIDKQLPATRNRVDQLQRDLQVFRQQNNFVDPNTQTTQVVNQASQLILQDLSIDQNLAQARAAFTSLQGQQGALAALNSAPIYQQLMAQLRQIDVQIAIERTRFQDDNLAVQVLREQKENILPVLREEAQRVVGGKLAEAATQIQALEVQRQALAQVQARVNQKSEELPVLIRRYTDLQRELQVATESLDRFLTARETLQINASQKEITWQIVETPFRFQAPVSPNIRRNIMLGLVASAIIGFGVAVVVDKLDDVYHSVEELKAKTKLPLLGAIPFQRQLEEIESALIQERKPLETLEKSPVSIDEDISRQISILRSATPGSSKFLVSLQVLHTKIQLLNPDQSVRSIVVSSASPEDGKSTIALYLAQTAAEMGQRVLLVDADLRQSRLQARLNLDIPKGLSNLLVQHLPLEEAIYQPLQEPGFFLLPTGELPPDPMKLLSSGNMHQFMEKITEFFDLVIYDLPSMDGLADASLLAPYADGILLVVRMGKTERFALAQTLENLKMSQMPILGIVANATK
jgi:polysaccharide biosynthesis transport protein